YIHTQRDVPGNLDPTKMRRAIFIAAASGWYLASVGDGSGVRSAVRVGELERASEVERRVRALHDAGAPEEDIQALWRHYRSYRNGLLQSYLPFGMIVSDEGRLIGALAPARPIAASGPVYRRIRHEGPMNGFGYSWFDDHLARARLPRPRLLAREIEGEGPSFGYEALNLVDGRRSVGEIRDELAATVGAAPVEEVAEYLATLARLGVIAETGR
ncbi:MAG TPA: PqqD family protein, partial [Allosphingosinicella sp.]|nr:PqqD family protein [Allosphingosinicella sp.]